MTHATSLDGLFRPRSVAVIGASRRRGTIGREQDWREIISGIRESFDGELTYSSNWYDEYENITFWDALDYIGVQAYFPLADRAGLSSEEIATAWKPWNCSISTRAKSIS